MPSCKHLNLDMKNYWYHKISSYVTVTSVIINHLYLFLAYWMKGRALLQFVVLWAASHEDILFPISWLALSTEPCDGEWRGLPWMSLQLGHTSVNASINCKVYMSIDVKLMDYMIITVKWQEKVELTWLLNSRPLSEWTRTGARAYISIMKWIKTLSFLRNMSPSNC